MADSETLPTLHCARCKAQEDAIPTDAALKILMSEDWERDALAFEPRAMNAEQVIAVALMTNAIGHYWKAFGIETTGAWLNQVLLVLRERARAHRINARILEARADINARARRAWESGNTDLMRQIEAEPTPDYPGKDRDDAWLKGAR